MPGRTLRLAFIAATLTTGCNSLFSIHEGTPRPMCVDDLTIDDMEDGDNLICRRFAGRNGGWFDFGDGSPAGQLTPLSSKPFTPTRIEDGSRGPSRYAARFSGSGFTIFGAIMGFELLSPKQSFDAGGLGGVTFWMKSDSPVAIDFPTEETVPVSQAGQCKNGCNDHFTFQITAPAPGWKKYDVPFNALRGGGGFATWNPRHLYGVNFRVPAGAPFDVWIDDVAFYECAGPECAPTCTDPRFPVPCNAKGGPRSSCQPPGTDCDAVESWCLDLLLIDDMEDGDAAICDSGGRQGRWSAYGDGTSTDLAPSEGMDFLQTAIPGGRESSHYAARLHGSGFGDVGAGMGFNLEDVGAPEARPYDASQFGGITFWMKTDVPVSVGLSVPDTVPVGQPFGTCNDGGVFRNCYNEFVFEARPGNNEWVEHTIPFAAFEQRAFLHDSGINLVAGSARWDSTRLLGIDFSAHYSAFDIWVDDIRFCPSPTDCVLTCSNEEPVACPASDGLPAGCWPEGTDCSKPRERVRNTAVWGSGPNDVWVVGYSRTTLQGSLRHWKDSAWVPATASVTIPPLWGVWGSNSDNVWAVGDHGTVLTWNGSDWSSTAGAPATSTFNGVWSGAAGDVWAVEAPGTMLHRTDSDWVPSATGISKRIFGVWGNDPGSVWAVGAEGTILHWTGSTWSTSTSGTAPLAAVWGSSSEDVWAVGGAGTMFHLTGPQWASVPSGTAQFLRGIWGSAPDDGWAVGEVGTIIHWDGHQWSAVKSGTTRRLLSVWGSGANDVWAVGLEIILHSDDGKTWTARP